jgi:hypothetical protein
LTIKTVHIFSISVPFMIESQDGVSENLENPVTANLTGRPVSGRVWKAPREKASARIAVKTLKAAFAVRMDKRRQDLRVKSIEKEIKQEKQDEKEVS